MKLIPRITYGQIVPYGLSIRGQQLMIRIPCFMWYGKIYIWQTDEAQIRWHKLELMFTVQFARVL